MDMNTLKKIGRLFLPSGVRSFIWNLTPRIFRINTCLFENPAFITNMLHIDERFIFREVCKNDLNEIEEFISHRGFNRFKKIIDQRLDSNSFVCIGVFDTINGKLISYGWIIQNSIEYFEEFGIKLEFGDYLFVDIYVLPEYRHLKLGSRLVQERTNFCAVRRAKRIYTQILKSNIKGNQAFLKLGYEIVKSDLLIHWPAFNVWRHFYSFLKNPFKKVIK
jgi:GNAT superfamily N-acetyltransferase